MKEQNYKNHGRAVIQWHFITGGAVLAVFAGSIINLFKSSKGNLFPALLLVAISFILLSMFWYARAFALRAQDRAIRAEENFRHFVLTGKAFPPELRMSQIIALRFASDEEFVVLTPRAVSEKMSSKQIKQAIKNWRPDHHRA